MTLLIQLLASISVSCTQLNVGVSHWTMPSPPNFSISAIIAQMAGAFLLSFIRAVLTTLGVTSLGESAMQALLGTAAFTATRKVG